MIKETKENFLLGRKEVLFEMTSEKNPTFEEAKGEIAKELKVDKDLVVIRKIQGNFGKDSFSVEASIYDSKENLEKVEGKKEEKKEEVKPAEEVPAEQPKAEEKPAEQAPPAQ